MAHQRKFKQSQGICPHDAGENNSSRWKPRSLCTGLRDVLHNRGLRSAERNGCVVRMQDDLRDTNPIGQSRSGLQHAFHRHHRKGNAKRPDDSQRRTGRTAQHDLRQNDPHRT